MRRRAFHVLKVVCMMLIIEQVFSFVLMLVCFPVAVGLMSACKAHDDGLGACTLVLRRMR